MRKKVAALAVLTVAVLALGWFYRPATSTEWAAWIQTLGVIAALAWGVKSQSFIARQPEKRAQEVAAIFAGNMHWVFRELHDACGKKSWLDYVVHRRLLDEILAQGREVTLQMLSGRTLAMVSSLRAIAVEAMELTEMHSENGNWGYLESYFSNRLPSIAAWLTATGNPPESNGPTDYAGLRTSFGNMN